MQYLENDVGSFERMPRLFELLCTVYSILGYSEVRKRPVSRSPPFDSVLLFFLCVVPTFDYGSRYHSISSMTKRTETLEEPRIDIPLFLRTSQRVIERMQ